ncbi:MAG TPA: 4Fe-4S ferredoxin, partial [Candidatus Aminicenantes bacterium]|nr:4Fe-4S ferredoxin [Candidatus Aminicenantes bacterium]
VVIGTDPVAVDAASLDLVESRLGRPLGEVAYDIPTRVQLEHAEAVGLGSQRYRLETLGG